MPPRPHTRSWVPDSHREMLYGGTIEAASLLSLAGAPMYLFVQCWTSQKGGKSAPLLEGVFQHETFCGQKSSPSASGSPSV
jgi:hypothetical protein